MAATQRLFEGLTFKVADDSERERALDLRRHIYLEELGDPGIDDFDRVAAHLIAVDREGLAVAALRVVGPRYRPFDLERFVRLEGVLPNDSNPAEVSRFCIKRNRRAVHRGQVVHLGMLKLLYEFARQQHITDLLVLALPSLQMLYEVAFFVPLDISVEHPTWGTVRVMRLDIAQTRSAQEKSRHPIARLLFRTHLPNVLLPEEVG